VVGWLYLYGLQTGWVVRGWEGRGWVGQEGVQGVGCFYLCMWHVAWERVGVCWSVERGGWCSSPSPADGVDVFGSGVSRGLQG
jgi:hypothetical protein